MKEWEVPCEWCGAKIGEPCVNNINGYTTETYFTIIHIPRARLYDQKHDLNFLDRPKLQKIKRERQEFVKRSLMKRKKEKAKP
jgi:hypothetical protein